MRTFETTVNINPDGTLILHLPPDVSPGPRRIVLVLEERGPAAAESLPPLPLQAFAWPGWESDSTFGREEL